jgi:cytochrome c oxidase subunit 2
MLSVPMQGFVDVASGAVVAQQQHSWWQRMWFSSTGSNFAGGVDALFYYIFWVSAAFFVLLMALMVYWGVKYRRRPGQPAIAEPSASHNTRLELAWSIIPSILMLVMFIWGARDYLKLVVAPSGAETINVTAKQWAWSWDYPNGAQSLETETVADVEGAVFALPFGTPVEFVMTSTDVIHSFYIPGFRIKRDVFPNRFTSVWATPTEITHTYDEALERTVKIEGADDYFLFCAEYCGDQHSQMANRIAILSTPDYHAWLAKQMDTSGISLVELGQKLTVSRGCMACHRIDDQNGSGPTWKGIWGEARPPVGGKSAISGVVDFNFVREAILEPGAYVRAGFANQMPSYQGQLSAREVLAIATYIKSLTERYRSEAEALAEQEMEARGEDGAPPDPERVFSGEGFESN